MPSYPDLLVTHNRNDESSGHLERKGRVVEGKEDSPGTISRYHIACGLGLFPPPPDPLGLLPFPVPLPNVLDPDTPLVLPSVLDVGLGGGFGTGARRGNGDGWN